MNKTIRKRHNQALNLTVSVLSVEDHRPPIVVVVYVASANPNKLAILPKLTLSAISFGLKTFSLFSRMREYLYIHESLNLRCFAG